MLSNIRFFQTPKFVPLLFPQLLWRISTTQKKLYLTFDDGPVPGPTEFVLEVLGSYNIKATFFVLAIMYKSTLPFLIACLQRVIP